MHTTEANPLKHDLYSHWKCLSICFVVGSASFQYGLDISMIGGFLAMPGFLKDFGYFNENTQRWAIDPTVQQLISSLVTLGTMLGGFMLGPVSNNFGRRQGLWAAFGLTCISAIIQMATTNKGALYFARLLIGWALAWSNGFSQLYLWEVAPAHLRGVVVGVYQSLLLCGTIAGSGVDKGTSTMPGRASYQIPLGMFFIIPVLLSTALYFFPESPRWLMVQGRSKDAADALRRLRNKNIDPTELLAELNTIEKSTNEQGLGSSSHAWVEMWRGTNLRRTLLCISVAVLHAGNGSSWITIYVTYFFSVASVPDPFGYSILVYAVGLLGCFFGIAVVRHVGRRKLMIGATVVCGLAQLMFAVAWTVGPNSLAAGKAAIAGIAIFNFAYAGYTPIGWLVAGEMVNNHLRPMTFGVGFAISYLLIWLGAFTAPYFLNPAALGWSAKYGYIWFCANIIQAIWMFFFMPETKDRTLEEIHEMFDEKVAARKFKSYVAVRTNVFVQEGVEQGQKQKHPDSDVKSTVTHVD